MSWTIWEPAPVSVVMGGQRLPIRRSRAHAIDENGDRAGEVGLASYGVFAEGDLLSRVAVERMLARVATRSFARAGDPIGTKARQQATATSKSAVSRRFATGTRKALEDMFTVRRLGIDNTLARTLTTTNMIESMISICRTTSRNVKRWRDEGDMRRRWCAAGMLKAEKKFRRLRGHHQMPQLVTALARHAETATPPCNTDQDSIAA